jgi:opacity protein-like surface antigen
MIVRPMTPLVLGLLMIGCLFPGVVRAQDGDEDFARPGFYLGAGATYAISEADKAVERVTLQHVSIDNTLGINARAGYRFLSWLAAELEYEWTSGFEAKGAGGAKLLSLEGNILTLNGKLILPTGRVQPYLLAGFGGTAFSVTDQARLGLKVSGTGAAARLGGGLDIYVTPHIVLNLGADVVGTTNNLSQATRARSQTGLDYVSTQLGLQYRW